jgi:capsular polysaccharide biosynthesis protein
LAWRSQKSAFRKRFNGRWLRWKAWRALFGACPLLARHYAFPMTGVAAIESASEVIENSTVTLSGGFTPAQMEAVVIPALANDKVRGRRAPGICTLTRQVAIIPDCSVLGHVDAVTRADGAMLYVTVGAPPNWNYAKPRRLRRRRFAEGLVTSLQDTRHYYHFLEQLLGLLGYLDREHRAGAPLTVLVPADAPGFRRAICAAVEAAYPGVRFVELAADERAEVADYLWLYEQTSNTEWLPVDAARGGRLAAMLRAHYDQPEPGGGELVFLSRGRTRTRRLINEDALIAVAGRMGFRRFEAVAENHAEQVRRFANADAVIAVHGAGLSNQLFCRPGTAVIELFPANCVKSTYLWLANRMKLQHHALLGSAGDYNQAFSIDPLLFEARLAEIMSRLPQNRSSAA